MACYANVKPIIDVVDNDDDDDDDCGFSHFIPADSPYFRLESFAGSSFVVYSDVCAIVYSVWDFRETPRDAIKNTAIVRRRLVSKLASRSFLDELFVISTCPVAQTKNVSHDRTETDRIKRTRNGRMIISRALEYYDQGRQSV